MKTDIVPVKIDRNGRVIPKGSNTAVSKWRVTVGKKLTGGNKQRRFFDTERDAKEWIQEKLEERKKKGQDAFLMPDELRIEAMCCAKRLNEFGVTLTNAVDYYLRHSKPKGGTKTLVEVCEEFLSVRKSDVACRSSTMKNYKSQIFKITKEKWAQKPIPTITQKELQTWLRKPDWSPRTKKNYIVTLTTIFEMAIQREYLSKNPVASILRPKLNPRPPGILTVEELSQLLAHAQDCSPELVPAIAIQAFAGLRRSEVCEISWSDIKWEDQIIEISASIAKSRQRRTSSIQPNLAKWLEDYIYPKEGKIVGNLSMDGYGEKLRHLFTKVSGDRPHNALRHSFGSYFYAKTKNENLTAAEMGNSPQIVHRNYKALVKPSAVESYWSITPKDIEDKVIKVKFCK